MGIMHNGNVLPLHYSYLHNFSHIYNKFHIQFQLVHNLEYEFVQFDFADSSQHFFPVLLLWRFCLSSFFVLLPTHKPP